MKSWIVPCILLVFLSFSVVHTINYDIVWWDTAVYTGMGKYLWSGADSGFWESYRPPLLPLILGLFWKIGIDPVDAGKLLALLFSLGTVYLTFLVGRHLYNRFIGLLAAGFTAFTYSFLFFSIHPLTEIPSTFFALAALFLLLRKQYVWSGVVFGLSFLMRYPQLMIFVIALVAFMWLRYRNRQSLQPALLMVLGFGLLTLPYFIHTLIAYGNPFYPLWLQLYFSQHTAFIEHQPWFFYIIELFKQNFLVVFLLLLPLLRPKKKELIVIAITIVPFLLYTLADHKEMRILLAILPFIYLLTAKCFTKCIVLIPKNTRPLVVLGVLLLWIALTFTNLLPLFTSTTQNNPLTERFIEDIASQESVGVSNPLYALDFDGPVTALFYYYEPREVIKQYPKRLYVNTCDLQGNSPEYQQHTLENLHRYETRYNQIYVQHHHGCRYSMYVNPISLS